MTQKEPLKKRFHVADLETLRAVSDPLRVQILELLLAQELTVRQVAEKLGLLPGKLYYHFATLEKLGAIKVSKTRMVSNMEEKTYRAAAEDIDVDPSLFRLKKGGDNEPLNIALRSTIDVTREDIVRSLEARQFQLEQGASKQPRRFIISRVVSRVSEKRVKEFQTRLDDLLKEFEEEDDVPGKKTDLQPYALSVAFYPSFYFEKPRKKSGKK